MRVIVGTSDGANVGVAVGRSVGASVGADDGAAVGVGVGWVVLRGTLLGHPACQPQRAAASSCVRAAALASAARCLRSFAAAWACCSSPAAVAQAAATEPQLGFSPCQSHWAAVSCFCSNANHACCNCPSSRSASSFFSSESRLSARHARGTPPAHRSPIATRRVDLSSPSKGRDGRHATRAVQRRSERGALRIGRSRGLDTGGTKRRESATHARMHARKRCHPTRTHRTRAAIDKRAHARAPAWESVRRA